MINKYIVYTQFLKTTTFDQFCQIVDQKTTKELNEAVLAINPQYYTLEIVNRMTDYGKRELLKDLEYQTYSK